MSESFKFALFLARRQNDELRAPLQAADGPGIECLQIVQEIFTKWKKSGNAGLTRETFLACIQSLGAFLELAKYLQQKHGFSYVLAGKFTSDPIEARFGWYRQVNGGNYFMCVKQLLQAEKKIRILSLLQQDALKASSRLTSSDSIPLVQADVQKCTSTCSNLEWLIEFFETISLDELSCTDANITYFIGGYVGRSISNRRRCCLCRDMLIASDCSNTHAHLPNQYTHLLEMADRGRLSEPTEFCFTVCALAVQYYSVIANNSSVKEMFFALPNQRDAFIFAITKVFANRNFNGVIQHCCTSGHTNFHAILETTYNCFAKNELKRINANRNETGPTSRKLRKLTSNA